MSQEPSKVYQADPAMCVRVAREHLWAAEQALSAGDLEAVRGELSSLRSWLHPGLEREWDNRMAAWMERVGAPREEA